MSDASQGVTEEWTTSERLAAIRASLERISDGREVLPRSAAWVMLEHLTAIERGPRGMSDRVPNYAIGSDVWPGLAKLAEELGELQQVIGKLMAYPGGDHPDGGPPLEVRLVLEAADVMGALDFVLDVNPALPGDLLAAARQEKRERFLRWHRERTQGGEG